MHLIANENEKKNQSNHAELYIYIWIFYSTTHDPILLAKIKTNQLAQDTHTCFAMSLGSWVKEPGKIVVFQTVLF